MIVELFGPPASGKTTFANALAAALRFRGCQVMQYSSSRPSEVSLRNAGGLAAPLQRVAKLGTAMPMLITADETTRRLVDLLPPRGIIWPLRLRRYLTALHRSWLAASAYPGVAIIDQGYMTALSSLLLLSSTENASKIAEALKLIPKPDLLVHLQVPEDILRQRLATRLTAQNSLERMFELTLDENIRQADITDTLVNVMSDQSWSCLQVQPINHEKLSQAVAQISNTVDEARETFRHEQRA